MIPITRTVARALPLTRRALPTAITTTTTATATATCHSTPITTSRVRYQSSWEQPRYFDTPEEKAVNNLLYNFPSKPINKTRRVLCALVANEPGVLSRISSVLAGRGFNIDSLVVSETEAPQLSRMTIVLKAGSDVEQAKRQLEDIVQVWAVVELNPDVVPVVERELLLVKLRINTILPPSIPPSHSVDATKDGSAVPPSPTPTTRTSPSQWMLTNTDKVNVVDVMSAHIQRQAIVELTELFSGRVVDVATEQIMVELTGKSSRIDAFIELIRPFGITELARSGAVAMVRGRMHGFEVPGEEQQRSFQSLSSSSSSSPAGGSSQILRKNSNIDESKLPPG